MKKPAISWSPSSVGGFLVSHGEKLAFAVVAAFAVLLAWLGIDAVRTQAVKPDRRPDAVADLAARATTNIDSVGKVPAERLPARAPLPPAIDPWRPQQMKIAESPTAGALLDRPLVAELSRRTKPDVFPIADLQAVAGIAVLPDTAAQDGAPERGPRQPDLAPPPEDDPRRRPPRGKPPRGRQTAGEASSFGLDGGMSPEMTAAAVPPQQPGKITPFVVVTGLIPVAKQQQEFERRFGSASFRDPRRDRPQWAVYLVERALVVPGGSPRWERLKVKDAARADDGRIGVGEMPGAPGAVGEQPLEQETLPQAFFLQPEETAVSYTDPLPQRIDEPWGVAGVHPWFLPKIEEFLDRDGEKEGEKNPQDALADLPSWNLKEMKRFPEEYVGKMGILHRVWLNGDAERTKENRLFSYRVSTDDGESVFAGKLDGKVFDELRFGTSEEFGRQWILGDYGASDEKVRCNLVVQVQQVGKLPLARIVKIQIFNLAGQIKDELVDPVADNPLIFDPQQPAVGNEAGQAVAGTENRLFRFVDTTVKPGESYRYRVKFALRNPNVGLASRHLADLAAAKGEFLLSEFSNETPPVRVPEPVVLMARTINKETRKRMKFKGDTLEVMILGPSEKTGNYALRSTVTDLGGLANVLSPTLNKPGDVRFYGEPLETETVLVDAHGSQDDRADIRGTDPPEPLEMLFVRPDGSFRVVAAADGERPINRYGATLFKPGTQIPDDGRADLKDRDRDEPAGGFPAEGLR